MRLDSAENGGYRYAGHTETTSFLARLVGYRASESAVFNWNGNGHVQPMSYSQEEKRIGHHEFWSADFDWVRRRARGDSDRGRVNVVLPEDALDPLTLRLQLALDLAAGRLSRTYPTVDGPELEYNRFLRRGNERMEVDGLCIDALRLERLNPGSSRRLYSWHSRAFHWLPVRILQQREGEDLLDIRLVESSLLDASGTCETG